MQKKNVKALCVCSVLAALYVALELIAMNTGILAFGDNYQIPVSCFPLILASVMFGPFWGSMTGIIGSLLAQLLSPYGIGWGSVIWMIPTIAYSLSVALLFIAFKKSYKPYILAIELIISSLVLSFLNLAANYSYNLVSNLSNILLGLFIPFKLVMAVAFAVIFAVITPPIIKKIKAVIKF